MTNEELIAEVRRLIQEDRDAGMDSPSRVISWQLADALAASECQRQELEAQAAVLAEALTASGKWMGTFLAAFGVGNLEPRWPGLQARALLANLPAAVQAHMARDRAAEGMAKSFDQLFNHPASTAVGRAAQWHDAVEKQAAYRAAGGEGK